MGEFQPPTAAGFPNHSNYGNRGPFTVVVVGKSCSWWFLFSVFRIQSVCHHLVWWEIHRFWKWWFSRSQSGTHYQRVLSWVHRSWQIGSSWKTKLIKCGVHSLYTFEYNGTKNAFGMY
jgi:hypothetical protein